jgi:hypothetical protein
MSIRTRQALVLLAAALAAISLLGPGSALAKKKAKRPAVLDLTNAATQVIPARQGPDGPDGMISSSLVPPKRFKGLVIRDVNVTLQTTGVTGNFPAAGVQPQLTAPNGATVPLFRGLQSATGAANIGPLTIDDESPLSLAVLAPGNPTTLYDPWVGSARPQGGRRLAVMDNGPVRGTWTLTVVGGLEDQVSVLNAWRIRVSVGRPYRTR